MHGRYPDNNDGLAVLDTFDARFKINHDVIDNRHAKFPDVSEGFPRICIARFFWAVVVSLAIGLMAGTAKKPTIGRAKCDDIGIGSLLATRLAVAKQVELINQYHTNGVINDATYRRLMDATTTCSN